MDYAEYLEALYQHRRLAQFSEYGVVVERGKRYPLMSITLEGPRWLVITSGFHGEEPAGPLTLARHLPEILDYAARRKVGLRIYPCINPSGFEAGTRYNVSGERPNNDFLRYETTPGVWKGELKEGEPYLRYVLFDGGPQETRALRPELERHSAPDAALDIHQDNWMPGARTYAYVFGPRPSFLPLMKASSVHSAVAASCSVHEEVCADSDGLVHFADGSITDYYRRRGVPYTAALETTTQTPLELCHQVNLVWIRGFVDLAAGPGEGGIRKARSKPKRRAAGPG